MTPSRSPLHLAILALCFVLGGCTRSVYEPLLYTPDSQSEQAASQPLKVHLQSGDVVLFENWAQTDSSLHGHGVRYNPLRVPTRSGYHSLPLDSIALLETHVRTGSRVSGVVGLALWSVVSGAVTISCVADPKSCFGSCPTFYVEGDREARIAAEGFSRSIARVLEARDLDALFHANSTGGPFVLTMRNEALETHAVRSLRLLAVPRVSGARIFADPDGRFFAASGSTAPDTCTAAEGDCREALSMLDGIERISPADSANLATRETIELTFPPASGRLGLVLGARQSLLTTYLFYEMMGYLGTRAAVSFADLERAGPAEARRAMAMADLVGVIDLTLWDGERWRPIGTHDEAGPLATQLALFPFEHDAGGPVRVRLSAPKGAWRLDWAALAALDGPLEPLSVEPAAIEGDAMPDESAFALLTDPARHLVTYPGDTYRITYQLPPAADGWELFLESEGYYYEWMREEWLADEDPLRAAMVIYDPANALKMLAPEFKRAEPEMERRFWNSRFRR